MSGVEPELAKRVGERWQAKGDAVVLAAVRALREISGGPVALLVEIARRAVELSLRDEALAALAAHGSPDAAERLVQ